MRVVLVDATIGPRAVPDGFGGVVIAEPGVPFEVSDEIGGAPPGPWETVEHDVPRQNVAGPNPGADLPDGYAYDAPAPGVFRRRHLGSGLLAQQGVWAAAAGNTVEGEDV